MNAGDGWEHEVVLERMVQPEGGQQYPRVIAGKRACPPEDCGGVSGYYHLLEVLANPKHSEHRELMEWRGGGIDPRRGRESPRLLIADGHLGIWAAAADVWSEVAEQRCWNHRILNVLDKPDAVTHLGE